jgi:hypothetical protein
VALQTRVLCLTFIQHISEFEISPCCQHVKIVSNENKYSLVREKMYEISQIIFYKNLFSSQLPLTQFDIYSGRWIISKVCLLLWDRKYWKELYRGRKCFETRSIKNFHQKAALRFRLDVTWQYGQDKNCTYRKTQARLNLASWTLRTLLYHVTQRGRFLALSRWLIELHVPHSSCTFE